MKKRLALFLDGTWNTEDDSTNVYHAYSLTTEGMVEDNFFQKRYYDPGVGTGMLDSFTGGGFGLGLDKNVRQAYNWLVDNYEDGDEIYIFGFSRGAFTARSLMGFLAACGLIRWGAPMNISQLWDGYVFASQNRDKKDKAWWERNLKLRSNQFRFRRIGDIKDKKFYNRSEQTISEWSRRVDINYMGIFDTVGAMGWQALGVPGLTSKLDQHHNPYPSGILKKCRHALAIDENRTSFRLTRLEHFINNTDNYDQADCYDPDINQCWFVGAHSNIGGGYPNNFLAARPLEWILEGARNEGLIVKSKARIETMENLEQLQEHACLADLVDSYADFAKPLWEHIIRAKRHFRPIIRPDLIQEGQALHSINEEIDQSVFDFIKNNDAYAPLNLRPYIESPSTDKVLKKAFEKNLKNAKNAEFSVFSQTVLIVWCILAALGAEGFVQFFFPSAKGFGVMCTTIIASFYVLINLGETWANLELTFKPKSIIPKVMWNILMWLRLLGILLFAIGSFLFIKKSIIIGWDATDWPSYWNGLNGAFLQWWPVLLAAVATSLLFYLAKVRGTIVEKVKTLIGVASASFLSLCVTGGAIALATKIIHFLKGSDETPVLDAVSFDDTNPQTEAVAGMALLAALLWFIFYAGTKWVGKPMGKARANLGSIWQLQKKFSNAAIHELFEKWIHALKRPREGTVKNGQKQQGYDHEGYYDKDKCESLAWERVKNILEEAIWRDMLGFIPIYTLVFGLILWMGTHLDNFPCCSFLKTGLPIRDVPLWLFLISVTAIADIVENTIHLHYLKKYRNDRISSLAFLVAGFATVIKMIGFFIAGLWALLVVTIALGYLVLSQNDGGWRWAIATAIIYIVLLFGVPSFLKMVVVPKVKDLFISGK